MSDYNFLMESRLSPQQFHVLAQVSRVAADQGLNLYLVGGAVRDLTYGQQTVHDLDFVTEGSPQRLIRHLENDEGSPASPGAAPNARGERTPLKIETLEMDNRLNAAHLQFTNGVRVEIAMSRSEVFAKPGRPPEILPAMIFEDLKRRDFSVNAMAVSLHPNSRGLLLDPTNGAADIEKHELRVMHGRSFSEDPVRIYRLLRLGLRLSFKPEERTRVYLETALENRLWEHLDADQQGRELQAILQEENPGRVFKMLAERGLLEGLDKKLALKKIPVDRFAKIRTVCQTVPDSDPYLLNFCGLVEKLPGGQKARLAKKILGHSKAVHSALGIERAAHKLSLALRSSKNALPSRIYRLLTGQSQSLLLYLLVYSPQAVIQNRIKSFLHKFPLVRARLPRAEFQAIGMKPGPKFEKILEQIFFEQIDGKIKTHQQTIKQLRALSGIKEPPPPEPPKMPKPAKNSLAAKPSGRPVKEHEKASEVQNRHKSEPPPVKEKEAPKPLRVKQQKKSKKTRR